jgi:predicted metal-dependent peptidase
MKKLAAGRVFAQIKCPYLAPPLMKLVFIQDNTIPTLDVNEHFVVHYNAEFLGRLTGPQVGVVLIHEVWHVLRGHFNLRRQVKQKYGQKYSKYGVDYLFNVCADAAINNDIRDLLNMADESGEVLGYVLPETLGCSKGLSTLDYFNILLDKSKKNGGLPKKGEIPWGSSLLCGKRAVDKFKDIKCNGAAVTEAELDGIRAAVAKAISSSYGTVPNSLSIWAENTLMSKVSWERELATSLRTGASRVSGQDDYSYRRVNRRYRNTKILYPGLVGRSPKVGVVIDSSGSMCNNGPICLAELDGISRVLGMPMCVAVVDTEVQWEGSIQDARGVELKGGGGTDMRVAFKWVERKGLDVAVVMTDGFTPWPKSVGVRHPIVLLVGGTKEYCEVPEWAHVITVE